jgi:DNA-binding SARP family transcriptional activator
VPEAGAVPQPPDAREPGSQDANDRARGVTPSTAAPGATGAHPVAGRDHNLPDEEDDGPRVLAPIGIAGTISVALAVGVTRAIRRRRRQRLHHSPNGTHPAASAEQQDLHRQLLVAADEDTLNRLAAALTHLANHAAATGLTCRPRIVQHGEDHIDVLLDQPTLPPAPGWDAQADGAIWTHPTDTTTAGFLDGDGTVATPLLVTLGQPDDGGQLYIDLEAERLIALTGDPDSARGLARALLTELAHSPFAAGAQILVLGDLDTQGLSDLNRVTTAERWDDIGTDLTAWAEQSRDALTAHGWPNPYIARALHADHDALAPIVVIADHPPNDPDTLTGLQDGHPAAAAIVVGGPPAGATVIDCHPDHLNVSDLGLTCRPQALTTQETAAIADLVEGIEPDEYVAQVGDDQLALALDHDTTTPEAAADAVGDRPYQDPPYDVLVQVLGDIEVVGCARPLTAKQTALVAYIALHGPVSADRVIDAVWAGPAAVAPRKLLANTISKCRAALGAHHLPIAKDGRYRIGPDVVTDIDLFDGRLAAAGHQPADLAAETLQGALDLVQGPIFTYPSTEQASYTWVDVENWISTREPKITAVAQRLAEHHLDHGHPDRAARLAEHTLRAVPTHTRLTETLMRAHAADGDRLAVQRVYQAHITALNQLDIDTVEPSTAQLYERLRAG